MLDIKDQTFYMIVQDFDQLLDADNMKETRIIFHVESANKLYLLHLDYLTSSYKLLERIKCSANILDIKKAIKELDIEHIALMEIDNSELTYLLYQVMASELGDDNDDDLVHAPAIVAELRSFEEFDEDDIYLGLSKNNIENFIYTGSVQYVILKPDKRQQRHNIIALDMQAQRIHKYLIVDGHFNAEKAIHIINLFDKDIDTIFHIEDEVTESLIKYTLSSVLESQDESEIDCEHYHLVN